jgi:hypothetical protein
LVAEVLPGDAVPQLGATEKSRQGTLKPQSLELQADLAGQTLADSSCAARCGGHRYVWNYPLSIPFGGIVMALMADEMRCC